MYTVPYVLYLVDGPCSKGGVKTQFVGDKQMRCGCFVSSAIIA
jgi:hypothetical protein